MTDTNQSRRSETNGERSATGGDSDAPDPSTRVSRRNLLLAATTATAVGVPGVVGGSRDGLTSAGVAVVGDESHRRLSRAVATEVRRDHPNAGVWVRSSETADGFERFAAGEVDVYVAGRPMLPAERDRAAANGVAYEGRELAMGGFALVHAETPWYDCVSNARLVETWADGDVATYAEVAGAGDAADTAEAVDAGPGRPAAGNDPVFPSPSDDARVVVRGTREFQYERGFGGAGYYEPNAQAVRPLADLGGSGDSHTPVVRLAFLYLNRGSLRSSVGAAFERAYVDRVARSTGDVTYYADPTGLAL